MVKRIMLLLCALFCWQSPLYDFQRTVRSKVRELQSGEASWNPPVAMSSFFMLAGKTKTKAITAAARTTTITAMATKCQIRGEIMKKNAKLKRKKKNRDENE